MKIQIYRLARVPIRGDSKPILLATTLLYQQCHRILNPSLNKSIRWKNAIYVCLDIISLSRQKIEINCFKAFIYLKKLFHAGEQSLVQKSTAAIAGQILEQSCQSIQIKQWKIYQKKEPKHIRSVSRQSISKDLHVK